MKQLIGRPQKAMSVRKRSDSNDNNKAPNLNGNQSYIMFIIQKRYIYLNDTRGQVLLCNVEFVDYNKFLEGTGEFFS